MQKSKKYQMSNYYFQNIINQYPYYTAEALYYTAYVMIKEKRRALLNKSGAEFNALQTTLVKARELFDERISGCSNDQAIVESFKKKEAGTLIHIEAFSEQQKSLCHIYNLFINSVNDILVHPVTHNTIVNFDIHEILAYDSYLDAQMQTSDEKFSGVSIIVENTDGSSHEYSSSDKASHTISLKLDDNHFSWVEDNNIRDLKNSCLYEALIKEMPSLKTMFSSGAAFREHLSSFIESDANLQYAISQGWHGFSIKKGSYGGAYKENNFDTKNLYRNNIKYARERLYVF